MAKTSAIPIRLDDDIIARFGAASEALGIPRSTIIRMLVERFVDTYEKNGGRITLPIQILGSESPTAPILMAAESSEPYKYSTPAKK